MGVLRTEREIARRLLGDERLRAIPVAFQDGQMFALEAEQARSALHGESVVMMMPSGEPAPVVTTLPSRAQYGRAGWLLSYGKAGVRALARTLIGAAPIYCREEVQQILNIAQVVIKKIFIRRQRQTTIPARDTQQYTAAPLTMVVHPTEWDVLWTCGEYDICVPLRRIAEQKRLKHFRVAAIGYDMIRLYHPEWNPPGMSRDLFALQTMDLLDAADLIYCISESTRRDLVDFAATNYRADAQLEILRLGSDLPADEGLSLDDLDVVMPQLAGRHFALAVGTVEHRKNYRLLLEVWIALGADPAFDLDLVIVGRPGQDSAVAELQASPLLGKRIFWLTSCPDSVLAQLYRRCEVVLCPSLTAGWGLSVAEGLAYGKPVVCSDRGGIAEAALNMASVLDPTDLNAWRETIQAAARAPLSRPAQASLPKWDMTADSVCRGLLTLVPAHGER